MRDLSNNDDLKRRLENIRNVITTGANSIVAISGASLVAMLAFTGAVWASYDKAMFLASAIYLRFFAICFLLSLFTYIISLAVTFSLGRDEYYISKFSERSIYVVCVMFFFTVLTYSITITLSLYDITNAFLARKP